MLLNVVPLRKDEEKFPDGFPKGGYLEVAHAVLRNTPLKAEKVEYSYALKPNEPLHHASAVILQAGGNVLFNPVKHFGDNSRLQNWVNQNATPLRQLAQGREHIATVVGKINKGCFAVYYVIEEDVVYIDPLSIGQRLAGYKSLIGEDAMVIMPLIEAYATMTIDRDKGTIRIPALEAIPPSAHVLALPVTVEEREDSSIPRLFTTLSHMRFFAFTYEGA